MTTSTEQSFAELQRLISDPNFKAVQEPETTEYRGLTIYPEGTVAHQQVVDDDPYVGIVVMDGPYVVTDGLDTVENAQKFIDRWLDEGWSQVAERNMGR